MRASTVQIGPKAPERPDRGAVATLGAGRLAKRSHALISDPQATHGAGSAEDSRQAAGAFVLGVDWHRHSWRPGKQSHRTGGSQCADHRMRVWPSAE